MGFGLTEEQKRKRRQGLGASDIPAILGASPWSGEHDVYSAKLGLAAPFYMTERMEWGLRNEPIVAEKFRELHPELLWEDAQETLTHPDDPIAMATPDGFARAADGTLYVVQIKTAGSFDGWGEPGTQLVPRHYRLQVLWEMYVTGAAGAFIPVKFEVYGSSFREYFIPRDNAEIACIVESAHAWWERRIIRGEAPLVDGPNAAQELLRKHPEHSAEVAVIEDEAVEQELEEYASAQARIKDLERAADEIKARILNRIAGKKGIQAGGFLATWQAVNRKPSVDWQAVARELGADIRPDVVAANTAQPEPMRRFTVKRCW